MDKPPQPIPLPNYLRKAREKILARLLPPGMYVIDVVHEDACPEWDGGTCNCDAMVHLRWTPPAAALN